MDQQQVDVLHLQPIQRTLEAGNSPVPALEFAVKLSGDEKLFAFEPTPAEPFANSRFVSLFNRGIDVPVAGFYCMYDGVRHLAVVQRPSAKTDLWNPVTVIQFDQRCECHSKSLSHQLLFAQSRWS